MRGGKGGRPRTGRPFLARVCLASRPRFALLIIRRLPRGACAGRCPNRHLTRGPELGAKVLLELQTLCAMLFNIYAITGMVG